MPWTTMRVPGPLQILNLLLVAVSAIAATQIVAAIGTPLLEVEVGSDVSLRVIRPPVGDSTGRAASRDKGVEPLAANHARIAARNLFSPTRSEASRHEAASPVPPTPPPPLPILRGVVAETESPIAYLEDAVSKWAVDYRVGDAVGDAKVTHIATDHVMLVRGDAPPIVLRLRDPASARVTVTSTSLPAEPPPFRGVVPPGPPGTLAVPTPGGTK